MLTRFFVFLLFLISARSDTNSTTKQTTQTTKITRTKIVKTTKTTLTTVTIPYRCYRTIRGGSRRPGQTVPPYIPRPAYVFNNGTELAPEYPLIKNHSQIEAINKSCSIAKSILQKLKTYVRVGITTEQMDIYAHELIIRRGAYPSYQHFNRYPKSITTSINNIVAFGKPDNTILRKGDIITVDISIYYNGYHGACAETFPVDRVDNAGRILIQKAWEITYAGINCSRPGESFQTLGRVIEQEAKSRGFKIISQIEGHGIGQFLREYPHILQFANNETQSKEIMQSGMVFTVKPAITDGNPDSVTLSEESDEYTNRWTVTTIDGSRTAQFGRTVLITDDGYEILSY